MKKQKRLKKIAEIIESVDNRCQAHDGPVGNTRAEMTDEEMSEIYRLAINDPLIGTGHLR